MTCSRTKKRPENSMRETNTIREDEVSRKAQGMGFVSPLVSPARKLTPHPPSLFSPFSRETVPAQSSTDFLTHTLRLGNGEAERNRGRCAAEGFR